MNQYRPHYAFDDMPHAFAVGQSYTGTSGNDGQDGTEDDDTFDFSQGGTDILLGHGGNDTFIMGEALDSSDLIDGGDGNDTVVLSNHNSNYFLSPGDSTFSSIETIRFAKGGDYEIFTNDESIPSGATMTFDATALGFGDVVYVNADETDGNIDFKGGGGADLFGAGSGGVDTFMGRSGNDSVDFFGDSFDANDTADGGSGNDVFFITRPASDFLTFTALNFRNFETLQLAGINGDFFSVTTNDANVRAGQTLTVEEFGGGGITLEFDGGAETDGRFVVYGGIYSDQVTGGARNDLIELSLGSDSAIGGGGDDIITVASGINSVDQYDAGLTSGDRLDGGGGFDTLIFDVPQGGGSATLGPDTIHGIERMVITGFSLTGPIDYSLSLDDANIDPGKTLTIDASSLGQIGDAIRLFVAANQADSHVRITAGTGDDILDGGEKSDVLIGGSGDDFMSGEGGADTLKGGAGGDTFRCDTPADSRGAGHDTIVGFDTAEDHFLLTAQVKGIDPEVASGQLREGHFTTDLAAALGPHQLKAHHAVLFTPDAGDDAGKVYLVVNNGVAGYEASHDFVFELDSAAHLNALDKDNFDLSS